MTTKVAKPGFTLMQHRKIQFDGDRETSIKIMEVIKPLRKKAKYGQRRMAELLGLDENHYCKIENGLRSIQLVEFLKCCEIFRLNINDFEDAFSVENRRHVVTKKEECQTQA
ncbi:MAG: helix-turn-helix domain-containing protein [Planctomycetota bacterium]|jgi:transcriptional regulator with XRE-family HTH domain